MALKKRSVSPTAAEPIVQYEFQHRTYQIDPERRKVYRRFVEIETAKAAEVFSSWRSKHVTV